MPRLSPLTRSPAEQSARALACDPPPHLPHRPSTLYDGTRDSDMSSIKPEPPHGCMLKSCAFDCRQKLMRCANRALQFPRARGDHAVANFSFASTYELRRPVLVAMAAAAVRFSTPSLA